MEQDTSSSSSSGGRKREREEQEEPSVEATTTSSSSASKRLCRVEGTGGGSSSSSSVVDQDLSSILEEAEQSLENGLLDEAQQGLVSDVMRSLEEELGVTSSSSSDNSAAGDSNQDDGQDSRPPPQVDIGYLLEASDDELGLEPSSSAEAEAEQPPTSLVEVEDLVRGESWNQSDWSAVCADFSNEEIFLDGMNGQLDQQEWLRRTLELLIGSSSNTSVVVPMGGSLLGQGFEPATSVREAGLIQ